MTSIESNTCVVNSLKSIYIFRGVLLPLWAILLPYFYVCMFFFSLSFIPGLYLYIYFYIAHLQFAFHAIDAMRCLSIRNIVATVARNQIEHRNIDDGSKLIEWSDECDCWNRKKVKRHDDEKKKSFVDSHNRAFYCYYEVR